VSSPWQVALGPSIAGLHPRLVAYFGAIPSGSVGVGEGVFDVVGTPRRWLWPVLAVLGRSRIVFPVWERDVPFGVVNRARAGAVDAVRTFRFAGGDRMMVDSIGIRGGQLTDRLGTRGRIESALEATIVDGHLELRSTRVTLRIGRMRIRIPAAIAPRVTLTERFDDEASVQRVSLALDAPLIGRVYEYSGSFTYSITGDQ
jgi:hypothetical protein